MIRSILYLEQQRLSQVILLFHLGIANCSCPEATDYKARTFVYPVTVLSHFMDCASFKTKQTLSLFILALFELVKYYSLRHLFPKTTYTSTALKDFYKIP